MNARLQALQALQTLRPMGADAVKAVVPVLAEMMKDPQPSIRFQAAQVLGQMGPEARDAVIAALRDLDAESSSPPALADHRDERTPNG